MRVALENVFFLLVFFIDCFLPGPLKTKCIFRWRVRNHGLCCLQGLKLFHYLPCGGINVKV